MGREVFLNLSAPTIGVSEATFAFRDCRCGSTIVVVPQKNACRSISRQAVVILPCRREPARRLSSRRAETSPTTAPKISTSLALMSPSTEPEGPTTRKGLELPPRGLLDRMFASGGGEKPS